MPHLTKKTVIITGYGCNNQCKFCIDSQKRGFAEKTTEQIIAEIQYARRRGRTYLEIIGGEQTIRPDIIELIKTAKSLGFKDIAMATNGRMLAYKDFAKRSVEAGLTHIIFSVHGHNSRLHDSLTQTKNSFRQLMTGIRNIKELKFRNIGTNTTIVKNNYRYLPEIARLILDLGIKNAEFIFVDPTTGGALEHFDEIVPKVSQAAPFIRQCLDLGKKNKARHWHVRYVPICHFINYESQISELYEATHFKTEHLAPDFKNFYTEKARRQIGRIKPKKCIGCKKYRHCEGLWLEYYRHFGDKELKPVTE